jgi:DNA repair protein RadC
MERKELIGVRESRTESSPSAKRWDHPGGKLIEEGSHSLKQAELLAILIGSGIAGRSAMAIANAILDEYVGLYGICRNGTLDGLARIPGVGPRKSTRILAAIEMGRRLHRHLNSNPRPPEENASLFGNLNPSAVPNLQAEQPDDIRLLATIIGSGVVRKSAHAIAKEMIYKYGSICGLFGRDMGDFLEIKGLNSVKIIRIAAALEVAKRIDRALA